MSDAATTAVPPLLRLLVAEDNPTIQIATSTLLLAHWQLRLCIAGDGRMALESAIQEDWDIILMDLEMPVLDGFEATRRIRLFESENPAKSRVPIIAYTASKDDDLKNRIASAGLDGILRKPASILEIALCISKWTGITPAVATHNGSHTEL